MPISSVPSLYRQHLPVYKKGFLFRTKSKYIVTAIKGGTVMEALEVLLHYIVEFSIIIFEFIGVGIIIVSGIIGFTKYLRRHPDTKIVLLRDWPWDWNLSWAARF